MISEAVHRGDTVYNLALRVDPNSLMRAAAFQLIRNVLHGTGTVIALRPEDNVGAATVEIVEAALASTQSEAEFSSAARFRPSFPMFASNAQLLLKLPSTNSSAIFSMLKPSGCRTRRRSRRKRRNKAAGAEFSGRCRSGKHSPRRSLPHRCRNESRR